MKIYLFIVLFLVTTGSWATEKNLIRLATLAFGTVNWELVTIKNLGLAEKSQFRLEIVPLANAQAGKIALQSGAVDMIVSDWIWVSKLRAAGADLTFYPYSNTAGALLVSQSSKIKTLTDLTGKKLGIAGGELDKNWLLLQALAQQRDQIDLNAVVDKVYGAPALLNQQLRQGRLDAVINYWHFAARLNAKGYQILMTGQQLMSQLGIKEQVPTLGYVFNRRWAIKHRQIVNQFLQVAQQAKNQLCQSDRVWQQIIPLTRVTDQVIQNKLREHYCAGRIRHWGSSEQQAASRIYQILRKYSNNKLTGNVETLQSGTFWSN